MKTSPKTTRTLKTSHTSATTKPRVAPAIAPPATPVAVPSPAATQATASPIAIPNILTMPSARATADIADATSSVTAMRTALPWLISLPATLRQSAPRLRQGEAQMLLVVLATCVTFPDLVSSLADEDNGVDPAVFETALISARIQLATLLAPLSVALTELASDVSDTMLYLNQLTHEPTLEAYAILKAVAKSNPALATAISPVIDYYGAFAKASAATRKATKAAGATAVTPATPVPPVVKPVTPT